MNNTFDNTFAERLRKGDKLIGSIVSLAAPEVAEIYSAAGLDWLFIDTEHGSLDMPLAQRVMQAARVPCVVRVADAQEATLKKALDSGAAGVIVPMVNSAVIAKAAVQFCKYPPLGRRGVGNARAQGYGLHMQEYLDAANTHTAVIAQIEHISAVDNIETIVKVSGIDALFIGPYDLSGSMGKLGQVEHPDVLAAIDKVREACQKAGRTLGIFSGSPDRGKTFLDQGYTLLAVGIDTLLLGRAARHIVDTLR